ncbi:MAG TPA: peptidylprolyl isomerase [Bacteroidales bacterium]|nr:peptidylprolyl isomerase [Bacteroidales bacterium]HPJ12747.1 peptidylprolyl isomerase [Caldisericia bacterium]HRW33708.1 peptidylprolyl isomerase [Thermotogota bacterium]
MKKFLTLLIVLTLVTLVMFGDEGDASTQVQLPNMELGTLSDEEIMTQRESVIPVLEQELEMAVRILENGQDTGYGVQMRDVESDYLNYEEYYTSQQNFNPVFDGIFVKFDLATIKAEGELLEIYAIKNNVSVDALQLEEETNSIVSEVIATEEYKNEVIANYGSVENFYEFVKMVKKDEMLRTKVIETVAPLTQAAIEKAFSEKLPDIIADYEQVKAGHILVETKEEALSIKEDIESGNITFEEAAKQYSIDGTAENGGMLGWVKRGYTVPEFEAAVFSGELNKLTPPVRSEFGYHIILPIEKTDVRTLESFSKMEEEYTQFKEQTQQELLYDWMNTFKKENNITFKFFDYFNSIEEFGKEYTQSIQSQDFTNMVQYLLDFDPESVNDRAFFEVAIESIIQIAAQVESIASEEDINNLEQIRLENLKAMSKDTDKGFAALSRYYSLNPEDTRMAMRFFDAFISEALIVAQDDEFMAYYGDQVLAQLLQAYPKLLEIGENPKADLRDRVIAYMYLIRINKISGETETNQEYSDRILELDPENEEVLKLIQN